jgi:hypothetical protein
MEAMKLLLEFIDEHVTAILVFSFSMGGILLMLMGKIPGAIEIGQYTTFAGIMTGLYVTYTTGKKFAKNKK